MRSAAWYLRLVERGAMFEAAFRTYYRSADPLEPFGPAFETELGQGVGAILSLGASSSRIYGRWLKARSCEVEAENIVFG